MKYVCQVHFAPEALSSLNEEEKRALDARSIAYNEELVAGGHLIAAEALQSPDSASTDWGAIVRLYDLLLIADRTPVVELNRAAAVSEHAGPEAGLVLMDALLARGELRDYRFLHSARAELLRRLGRHEGARAAYRRALELTAQEPERRFLERRMKEVEARC